MDNFKKELSQIGQVYEWTPTREQLDAISNEIENEIRDGQKLNVGKIQSIISRHCPGALFGLFEGTDNSDLNSLLLLAIKKKWFFRRISG